MSVAAIKNGITLPDGTQLGGYPTRDQLRATKDEGFGLVINLAPTPEGPRPPEHDFDEATELAALGLAYVHIPVPWLEPSDADFARFCAAMDGPSAGHKTLVHCAANYRVTAFYALYGVTRLGWSRAQAEALIARIWSKTPVNGAEVWRRFIDEQLAQLGA